MARKNATKVPSQTSPDVEERILSQLVIDLLTQISAQPVPKSKGTKKSHSLWDKTVSPAVRPSENNRYIGCGDARIGRVW